MSGNSCIIIAGMTPSTGLKNLQMVAKATNAGYHCELAGGALHTEHHFRTGIHELSKLLESRRGIHIN